MAYQTHGRDPLLDSNMQAALERRGRELIGILLVLLGLATTLMIVSYSPDDPNWMVATDAPVQNWMGRFGATIAAPLVMIIGWGALSISLLLMTWGARVALDRGRERALGRLIFAPIAVAIAAIYAATLNVPEGWTHSFGLGGLFGDTVLAVLAELVPLNLHAAIKTVSLVTGPALVVLGAYVLGFVWPEIYRLSRWLILGLVLLYAYAMKALGRGARIGAAASVQAAQNYQAHRAAKREQAASDQELWAQHVAAAGANEDLPDTAADEAEKLRVAQVIRARGAAEQNVENNIFLEPEEPKGLRGLMPTLKRREPAQEQIMPAPELVEQEAAVLDDFDDAPLASDDRIRSKIAKAIGKRERAPAAEVAPVMPSFRAEPRLTAEQPGLRAEPPVTAPVAQPELTAPMAEQAEPMPETAVPAEALDLSAYAPEPAVIDDSQDAPSSPLPRVPMPEAKKVVQHAPKKQVRPSTKAMAEAQPALKFEDKRPEYECPPLSLLMNPIEIERHHLSDEALEENARMLESVLDDYGVKGEIVSVRPGPVVTMYELEPAPGLKASRVIGLSDDIARSMSALSARVSTVPGRSVIGIELPNANREKVVLREILSGRDFGDTNMRLPLALGKDIGGDPIVANLAKMPHLLIAGTTGSGKSVAINTMILSLLYKLTPEECRLIMIDPKMLELSVYDGIPHLLSPVVTDPKKAVVALKWVVGEMEERYRKMSKMGVRNIEGFNSRVADALSKNEMFTRTVQTGFDEETGEPVFETEESMPEKLPYIVVIVDEMADLMMVAGKEIEACIQRLAQMARASGIHLIMATQRPSVDVITGTIKANFPTRISFQVTSKVDSRTILGEMGAEQLLGMGDMLYMAGGAKITRVHGPFCSDEEVEEIVNYLKAYGPPEYVGGVVDGPADDKESDIDLVLGLGGNTDGEDALYDQAVAIVIRDRKCSTSYIQRKLAIGYNKAARLVEQMEDEGVVSAANHVGKREILVPEQQ